MNRHTLINWSIEFGPIILFFVSLWIVGETAEGFVTSTGLFTIATIIALAAAYIREKRIAPFPIITGVFIIGFGLGTVATGNPLVFILKDTLYNGFFALMLIIGLFKGKGYLKLFFSRLFDMTDEGWRQLSVRWMIMFVLLTISNEITWRLFSRNVWVVYKLISTIITIIFGLSQFVLAKRFRNPTASAWGMRTDIDMIQS